MKKLGLSENIAGALSYSLWIVTGIIFLVIEKENKFVRFHAMQSILCSLALGVVHFALKIIWFIPVVNWFYGIATMVVGVLSLAAYVYLIFMAYKGQTFKVPILGDVAWEQVNR